VRLKEDGELLLRELVEKKGGVMWEAGGEVMQLKLSILITRQLL